MSPTFAFARTLSYRNTCIHVPPSHLRTMYGKDADSRGLSWKAAASHWKLTCSGEMDACGAWRCMWGMAELAVAHSCNSSPRAPNNHEYGSPEKSVRV